MFELSDKNFNKFKEKVHPKQYIKDLSLEELKEYLISIGEEAYRASQIFYEIYSLRTRTFLEMNTLPKELRGLLAERFFLDSLSVIKKRVSADGSIKYLFELYDRKSIEAVYMPWTDDEGQLDRSTLCISSMAGCPVGCAFCATGTLGFKRNLSPSEIIEQIFEVEKDLNVKITNIVFMGMGEPLLNYDNVVKSLKLMTCQKYGIISRRRITLSTSGIAPRIKQLADIEKPPKLAISLHATTNGTRKKLMPISNSFDLTKLMDAVEYYYRKTKMKITYEYILFDGLNDTDADIERLRKIALRVPSRVNFIPYNDISFTDPQGFSKDLKGTPKERIEEIANKLRSNGVAVILRETYGGDIEAACGQLALSE